MPILPLLLVLLSPQDPSTGEVGKIHWPPRHGDPLHYQARFSKRRHLTAATAQAARQVAEERGLRPSRGRSEQQVALAMEITLTGGDSSVRGAYRTEIGKQSLRLKLLAPRKGERCPPLGNARAGLVWGPAPRGSKPLELSRTALDRNFEMTFRRRGSRRVQAADFTRVFGDHLLPVLWNGPLPCWADEMIGVLDLDGHAVIAGKSLIGDRTTSVPLGFRNTRVEFIFGDASASRFGMRYKMRVDQLVSRTRDYAKALAEPYHQILEIEGEATYSLSEQAFLRVRERVAAHLQDAPPDKLLAIHDEEFTGTIAIDRVKSSRTDRGEKKRSKRRHRAP